MAIATINAILAASAGSNISIRCLRKVKWLGSSYLAQHWSCREFCLFPLQPLTEVNLTTLPQFHNSFSFLAISFYYLAILRVAKSLVAALKVIEKISSGVSCEKPFVVINVVPQVALKVLSSNRNYHNKSMFFRKFQSQASRLLS
jgi:hypothetical protein